MGSLWLLCLIVTTTFGNGFPELHEVVQSPNEMANHISKYLNGNSANISELCARELDEYSKALKRGKLWALRMFDSSARFPGGIFSGHIGDLGAFDQCLDIEGKSDTLGTIYGKYCAGLRLFKLGARNLELRPDTSFDFTSLGFPAPAIDLKGVPMMWAVCSPSSCSAKEIRQFYSQKGTDLLIVDPLCQDKPSKPSMDGGAIATIAFLGIILVIMVISTIYDVCIYFKKKKPVHSLFVAFSMFTNGKKLLESSNDPSQLSCLHGIRAITMTWVIILHKYIFYRGIPVVNWFDYNKWYKDASSQFILGAYLAVDTFLLLSGLLIAYIYMKSAEKGGELNFVKHYVHRYLRITPALAVVMLIHVTLIDYMVTSPAWPGVAYVLSQPCKDDWWTGLIYIQNYYDPTSFQCNGPTWYLSVDMQLYLLSPFLLIALKKRPKYAFVALGLLTCGSVLSALLIVWFYKIRRDVVGLTQEQQYNHDKHYYFSTHTRAAPWLIGIALGYIIYITKRSKIDIKIKKYQLHTIIFGLWGITLTVIATCVYGGYDVLFGEYKRVANMFYLGLVPSAWALAISWLIFACVHGYGGPINWFLSLPVFQFISKLSYSMYLLHYLIMFMFNYGDKTFNKYFSNGNTMYEFWPEFMFVLFAAISLMLAFEAPIPTIEKIIFGTPKRGPQTNRKKDDNVTLPKEGGERP